MLLNTYAVRINEHKRYRDLPTHSDCDLRVTETIYMDSDHLDRDINSLTMLFN